MQEGQNQIGQSTAATLEAMEQGHEKLLYNQNQVHSKVVIEDIETLEDAFDN